MAVSCGVASCSLDIHGTGTAPRPGDGGGDAGGQTGGGGGAPAPLGAWVAYGPAEDGTLKLPSWLVLKSPSAGKTVQISPSEIRIGFPPDAPRARNAGGGWGLSVESARTNRIVSSHITLSDWKLPDGSAPTLMLTTGPDGPQGANAAAIVSDIDMAASTALIANVKPAPGAEATVSAWVAMVPAMQQVEISANNFSTAPPSRAARLVDGPQMEWRRVSFTGTEDSEKALDRVRPAYAPVTATGSAAFDYVNHETGRYPSSAILTGDKSDGAREVESLYAGNDASRALAPGGRFDVSMVFAPNYAAGEQSSDHDLLFFDKENRVYLSAADHDIVVMVKKNPVLKTKALTWAREDAITLHVANTATTLSVTVLVKAVQDTQSVASPGAFPAAARIYILGDDTGSQECADLRSITFADPK